MNHYDGSRRDIERVIPAKTAQMSHQQSGLLNTPGLLPKLIQVCEEDAELL